MTSALLFFAAYLALPLFGAPASFHPSVRGMSIAARAAVAFGAGAVLLTVEMTLFSTLGIRWGVAVLSLPLLAGSLVLSAAWASRPFPGRARLRSSRAVGTAAVLAAGLAVLHLILSLATARSTSADFLLFWGVKGTRFAVAGGIDAELLRSFFSHHLVPDYPPLVPLLFSWGSLVAGTMPWRSAPVSSALWLLAAIPLVAALLRRRLSGAESVAVASFWTVALSVSLVNSGSGGSAEAPLLFFETVAVASLLAEKSEERVSRFLPALALAGAALTKVEGAVAVVFLVIGAALRDRLEGRPRLLRHLLPLAVAPAVGLCFWFVFQAVRGLRVGFRPHGELLGVHFGYLGSILPAMARNLDAGTAWLSWIVPLGLLIVFSRKGLGSLLPALSLAIGLFAFFFFDYLHDTTDPAMRIQWTLPRITQPCLSAIILAAGSALASRGAPEPAAAGRKLSSRLAATPVSSDRTAFL
jgi:hypothetical protein